VEDRSQAAGCAGGLEDDSIVVEEKERERERERERGIMVKEDELHILLRKGCSGTTEHVKRPLTRGNVTEREREREREIVTETPPALQLVHPLQMCPFWGSFPSSNKKVIGSSCIDNVRPFSAENGYFRTGSREER